MTHNAVSNAPIKSHKNLLQRLFSTLIGVPLLVFLIFAEATPRYPAIIYVGAGIFFSVIAALEFFLAARRCGFEPNIPLACAAVALLQLYGWHTAPDGLPLLLTALFALLLIAALMHTVILARDAICANLGITLLGVAYAGWLFSYLIRLRTVGGIVSGAPFGWQDRGAWLALFVFFVTFAGDTAAYFVGRALGKHPLAPRLSPAKTVEGGIGGIVGSVLMAVWIGGILQMPLVNRIGIGVLLAVLAQMGDLFASALKRDFQIKDFGGALPGHGGVLDRFDGLLFAAPIAYYLFTILH